MRGARPWLWLAAGALTGCWASLPEPPVGGHEGREPVPVQFPPPPARVDVVRKQPDPKAVWVDGQWTWDGRRWRVWESGEWIMVPDGAVYAKPLLVRRSDGQLVWFSGTCRKVVDIPCPKATPKGAPR